MPRRAGSRLAASLLAAAALCRGATWLAFSAAPPAGRPAAAAARREFLVGSASAAAAAALLGSPLAAGAVEPCKDGANNCYSSASPQGRNYVAPWVFPAGTAKADAVKQLKEVLEAYPKEGQDGVDQGGWSFADDQLDSKGYARLEYLSGIGNFARFFNGGKPFVDDLEVSVGDASVSVKSASRVGDSDLGVNTKRLNYLAKALSAKGWTTTAVKPL